ncbi:MAG: hypothetical protein M3Q07_04040 [Pseudobdellovibrionaceae bacterium]|nr:hypothetical protein [Pseudobdellovibrionaceae bacterium]
MQFKTAWFLALIGLAWLDRSASAQTLSQVYGDSLTKQAQTLYIKGIAGMTTFDSEAAGSKETRTTTETEFGGWMGESRVVGLKINHAYHDVPFELNQSHSRSGMTDVRLQARVWFLQPSIGVSLTEWDVTGAEGPTVGIFATGINAGLGLVMNLHQGLVFHADLMRVQSLRTFDKLDQGAELGDREDVDTHFAFDLTERILDFVVGYRMRSYTLTREEITFKETSQGAYVGLRLGYYF